MSPEAYAWMLSALLAALYLLPDLWGWAEQRRARRIQASRRALARKDQS